MSQATHEKQELLNRARRIRGQVRPIKRALVVSSRE